MPGCLWYFFPGLTDISVCSHTYIYVHIVRFLPPNKATWLILHCDLLWILSIWPFPLMYSLSVIRSSSSLLHYPKHPPEQSYCGKQCPPSTNTAFTEVKRSSDLAESLRMSLPLRTLVLVPGIARLFLEVLLRLLPSLEHFQESGHQGLETQLSS